MNTTENNPKTDRQFYQLGDDVLVAVAKLLQVALLTGTNAIDHFRTIRMEADKHILHCTPEFQAWFDRSINQLLEDAQKIQAEVVEDNSN